MYFKKGGAGKVIRRISMKKKKIYSFKRKQLVAIITLVVMLAAALLPYFSVNAAGNDDIAVTDSIFLDENGNFVFISYDKKKTSSVSYKTIGFTISRCVSVAKEEYVPEEYIKIALSTTMTPCEVVSETNSHICNKWTINADYVMSLIAANYPDWAAELTDSTGYYLKFDAVMVVVHNGHLSGSMFADGTYLGTVYDKHSKDALKSAEAWADPGKIDTHFDKYFFVGEMLDDDVIDPTDAPEDEFVETIGKKEPYYRTWNFSTGNKFDLSKGIPTSEDITNGFEADGWYGIADIGKHKAYKSYTFNFTLNYKYTFYEDGNPVQTDAQQDYAYTLTLSASYFYIQNIALYDFKDAFIENSVYPGDAIVHTGEEGTVNFDVKINGHENPTEIDTWYPNDKVHIKWPAQGEYESSITVDGTLEDAKEKAQEAAQDAVGKAKVYNDRLTVNDKTYMSDEEADGDSPLTYEVIGDGDYAVEEFEETVTIPSNVANGVYPTTNQVRYIRAVLNTGTSKIFEALHIKEGFEQNEPVHVHTPVISPVTIIDPDTGDKFDGEQTQLIEENRVNVEYELLLDGTYTFQFDPEMHREIQGYGWSEEPSKYDKYTAFKEVMFPFDVEIDGELYEKNYWITLADFYRDTFYIPPWVEENKNYVIKFRVAPENVVDEQGVNHIDDTQYLANLDIAKYVATYEIPVEVSGRIYGFEAVGVNDRDTFAGSTDASQRFSLVDRGWEKKVGQFNRIGKLPVRRTKDGIVTDTWEEVNTLPFSAGRSNIYAEMGWLTKGTDFSFTFYTMANLADTDDSIIITPTFRYVDKETGAVKDDIKVYYHDENDMFIEVGSAKDEAHIKPVSLDDSEFDGAYTQGQLAYTVARQHGLDGVTALASRGQINEYLHTETDAVSMGRMVLKNPLRLLMDLPGALEQMERNLSNNRDALVSFEDMDGETEQKLKESIQKWYCTYRLPSKLFVCDDDIDLWEYAQDKYGITEYDDVFLQNGYLVVNFEIETRNNGAEHLEYFPSVRPVNAGRTSVGERDQWRVETFGEPYAGQTKTVTVMFDGTEITTKSGDVAVIALFQSINDRYKPGILIIN